MNELEKKEFEKAVFANQVIEHNYALLSDKGSAIFDFEKKPNVDYFLIGYMQTGIQIIAGEKLPEYKALYDTQPITEINNPEILFDEDFEQSE
uniref:hypothetical protein n=1 Tax=Lactococcus sp. TaxID=44273 RepID=UPI0034DCF270